MLNITIFLFIILFIILLILILILSFIINKKNKIKDITGGKLTDDDADTFRQFYLVKGLQKEDREEIITNIINNNDNLTDALNAIWPHLGIPMEKIPSNILKNINKPKETREKENIQKDKEIQREKEIQIQRQLREKRILEEIEIQLQEREIQLQEREIQEKKIKLEKELRQLQEEEFIKKIEEEYLEEKQLQEEKKQLQEEEFIKKIEEEKQLQEEEKRKEKEDKLNLYLRNLSPDSLQSLTNSVNNSQDCPSWAILTPRGYHCIFEICKLLNVNTILEIGAGNGFNANLIREYSHDNIKVIATDPNLETENLHIAGHIFHEIIQLDGLTAIERYDPAEYPIIFVSRTRAFFTEVFKQFVANGGVCVVMIGDGEGYSCADELFYKEIMDNKWLTFTIPYGNSKTFLGYDIFQVHICNKYSRLSRLSRLDNILEEINDITTIRIKRNFYLNEFYTKCTNSVINNNTQRTILYINTNTNIHTQKQNYLSNLIDYTLYFNQFILPFRENIENLIEDAIEYAIFKKSDEYIDSFREFINALIGCGIDVTCIESYFKLYV